MKRERNEAGRPNTANTWLKRDAILQAAKTEFLASGFHGTSIRAIAERAGVSTRTLYNHFADKLTLFEAHLKLTSEALKISLQDTAEPLEQQLKQYATAMQQHLLNADNLQLTRLLYREGPDFTELQTIARVQFERYHLSPVAHLLKPWVSDEDRRRELAAHFVVMTLSKVERSILFNDPAPTMSEINRHAISVTELFVNGVRGR